VLPFQKLGGIPDVGRGPYWENLALVCAAATATSAKKNPLGAKGLKNNLCTRFSGLQYSLESVQAF
jgi:hypothetical protein